MKIKINGKDQLIEDQISLESLLSKIKLKKEKIAIEVNGKIIPKKDYKKYHLKEKDKIEVVSFVGGG